VDAYKLRFGAPQPESDREAQAPADAGTGPRRPLPAALAAAVSPPRIAVLALAALAAVAVWLLSGTTSKGGIDSTKHAASAPSRATVVAAPSLNRSPVLTLTAAHGDCWLLVRARSSGGPVVYERMLRKGQRVRFGLRKPVWIRLGAPWNMAGAIGRRPVVLPRATGSILATSAGITAAKLPPSGRAPLPLGNAIELNTRGYELMLSGNYGAALPLLQRAAARLTDPANPVTAYANYNLGQTLVRLGRCYDAIAYLEHAAELEPTRLQVHDALGYARQCSN